MTSRSKLVLMWEDPQAIPSRQAEFFPAPYELFDAERRYDTNTVFVYDHYQSQKLSQQYLKTQLEQGYRVIYDYKNEHWIKKPDLSQTEVTGAWAVVDLLGKFPKQHLWLHLGSYPGSIPNLNVKPVPAWYWILTATHWSQPPDAPIRSFEKPQYKILCMMNQIRPWRDQVWTALDQFDGQVMRSYVERGFLLPHDAALKTRNQYHLNANWFNNTAMSLVCESTVSTATDEWGYEQETALTNPVGAFLSEKTFKAMAMAHPYMLIACPGCLQVAEQLGFETFADLWDQSYDNIENFDQRLHAIVEQLKAFDINQLQQPMIQQKLLHNQQRLFDPVVIQSMIKNQILDPIEEFLYET